MTGLLEPLGAWVSGLRYEHIPEAARRAARLQMLDFLAAVHATARAPELESMLRGMPYGSGAATVIATGGRHSPAEAAFLNAAYSMAQDYDSIVWMGHTSHSAVAAALAVAEHERSDTRALVTAIVAANEIAGRLGASSLLGPLNGQMWTFIHLVGAAAATASLLGLDAQRATHALAISLAQPTYALQAAFLGPTSKLLAASVPTQIGVQAAYLARNGMTGAVDVLEDRRGFWHVFTFMPLPEMLGDLGELWAIETLELKSAPCCHYFQTACEALEDLLGGKRASLDEIRRVHVATTKLGDEVTRFAREYGTTPDLSAVGASFDLGVALAVVLEAGHMSGTQSNEPWLHAHAAALRAWYERIVVEHDPVLTARVLDGARAISAGKKALRALGTREWLTLIRRYRAQYGSQLLRSREISGWMRVLRRKPAAPEPGIPLYFPNRVTIERADGTHESRQIDLPAGALGARIDQVLRTKWQREVTPRLGAEQAGRAFEMGLAIEQGGLPAFMQAVKGSAG